MTPAGRWAALLLLAAALRADAQPSPPPPIPDSRPVLEVNAPGLPDASLLDFSYLLDAPTGKHGRLFAGTDGHFYFEDGTPGRFWGINLGGEALWQPHEVVDGAVARMARAGFNLVRLHHLDEVTGLLPPGRGGSAERLDPERLDALFYWLARCGERGIYVYLDLLDARTFWAGEGVPNGEELGRGAKPAALFDRKLLELQVSYAEELLTGHRNPYTQLTLAQDPTVCLLELCSANGLFLHHDRLADLPEPYRTNLREQWNAWLLERHGSTEGLREAWTALDGSCPLGRGESLEFSSVPLPRALSATDLLQYEETGTRPYSIGQHNEFEVFCYGLHAKYLGELREALQDMGVDVPVTAVNDPSRLADLRSVADSLDFVATNWHYDYPQFNRGAEWQLPAYFTNRSPITDDEPSTFVRRVLLSRVRGKPLVVREWGVAWPNKLRGCGVVEAAAYAALQDLDGLILFEYDPGPDRRRLDYFHVGRDPVRWQLCGPAAHLFLRVGLAPARRGR